MVSGHLQIKKEYYYIVLNYFDEHGKRKSKWISTGLPIKNNKKRAETMLLEARRDFVPPKRFVLEKQTFADFMEEWLETVIKPQIQTVTYASYSSSIKKVIVPYFKNRKILLKDLTARDIQLFYANRLNVDGVKAASVKRNHANIRKALQYAVKMDMIPYNPADRVDLPRQEKFIGEFYDASEALALLESVKGHRLELAVLLATVYGLRRGEIIGLRWSSIDFKAETITVRHTVTSCFIDGKTVDIENDRPKSRASLRTLPLIPMFKERLLAIQNDQERNQKMCGRSYNTDYLESVYVDEMGNRIKPDYITGTFPKLLEKHGLRKIRFHDLRHTAASLLLANGIAMKQIQEWMGHSDFSTTANIYAHLDYNSKISSANAMINGLNLNNLPVSDQNI